jgi:hypothetical protein
MAGTAGPTPSTGTVGIELGLPPFFAPPPTDRLPLLVILHEQRHHGGARRTTASPCRRAAADIVRSGEMSPSNAIAVVLQVQIV